MRYLLIGFLLFHIACNSSAQRIEPSAQQTKAERKPFKKSAAVLKSPVSYANRETEKGEYDPKPRVVLIDEKAGKYELRWIGYDAKEKVIAYQRSDSIDGVVEARIEKTKDGKLNFKYLVKNLPESRAYLSGFTVQTLTSDIKDDRSEAAAQSTERVYVGHMANFIPDFSVGVWRRFVPKDENFPKIDAGKSIEFSLVSVALPGIVGCRATGGDLTLKGVGEHMPSELERAMPNYDEWATGYTIGPVERLSQMSKSERAKYLLENLPKFLEAGWITADAAKKYEAMFRSEDIGGAFEKAKKDLAAEVITSEVYHIIEGLNN